MKDFISRLFKKKNPESVPEPKEGTPSKESPESVPKESAKVESKKAEPPKADPIPAEPAKPAPKIDSPPVLVPLYGKKEPPEPVSAEVPDSKAAPHQHLPFEDDLQAAITILVVDLAEVYPQSFEEWEDGFRRDDNPEQEIAGWVHLASILKTMSTQFSFGLPEKKECFNLLIACFTGSCDTVRDRSKPVLLTEEQWDQAISYFYEGGY